MKFILVLCICFYICKVMNNNHFKKVNKLKKNTIQVNAEIISSESDEYTNPFDEVKLFLLIFEIFF